MEIDIKTAAMMLGTSEATVKRWARQGKIPSIERMGEYFFREQDLYRWANQRNIPISKEFYLNKRASAEEILLSRCMERGGVFFGIKGETPAEVLAEAVKLIPLPDTVDREMLLDRLLQREALTSTGIGNGVAVPHPRYPLGDIIPQGGMVVTCFLEKEIDFKAIDGQPVFVLFIILSPDTKTHLKILSLVSFCLRNDSFVDFLKRRPDPDALIQKVKLMEEKTVRHSESRGKIIIP